jgi:hypothetical protein
MKKLMLICALISMQAHATETVFLTISAAELQARLNGVTNLAARAEAVTLALESIITNANVMAMAIPEITTTNVRAIPTFTTNTASGTLGTYTISASSTYGTTYFPYRVALSTQAVNTANWAVATGSNTNFWVQITLPTNTIMKSAVVASRQETNSVVLAGWKIEGSNDSTNWADLYTSESSMSSNLTTIVFTYPAAFMHYRMFAPLGTGSNPGMSAFWLYRQQYTFKTVVP